MIETILLFLACHFIADFPFQGEWIANNKGKSNEILFYHCAIYVSTFVIFAKVSIICALILFVSHFIIDILKARYKVVKHIWLDQVFHVVIIILLIILKY